MAIHVLGLVLSRASKLITRFASFGTVIGVALAYLYFSSVNQTELQTNIMTCWSLMAQTGIILGAVVFFLFGTNIPSQLVASGLLIICAVNLLLQYLEFSGRMIQGIPFEAFWVVGQLSIFSGIVGLSRKSKGQFLNLDFNFKNPRARFVLSLVGMFAVLHICWRLFFVSFGMSDTTVVGLFLSIIFLSLTFTPITLLFKSLFIKPMLETLSEIYHSKSESGTMPYIDDDLRDMGTKVVKRMVEAERAQIESEAFAKVAKQVTHDIRSPVGALKNAVSSSQITEPEVRLIRTAADRILKIASDLLSASGVRSTKRSVTDLFKREAESFNLSTALRDIIDEKRLQYRERPDLEISFQDIFGAWTMFDRISRSDFDRAISNLIDNAAEAISDSGRIVVEVLKLESLVTINISDTGAGISPELASKIGAHGFTTKESGQGLGLWSSQKIFEQAGGTLTISSRPGSGTTVRIQLPISKELALRPSLPEKISSLPSSL